MSLLELRGITKSFSGFRVLEGVDLDVRPAEVHALAGENGAGKSTLMNIVSGVLAADSGQILWEGKPVQPRSPRDAQNLGIAFVHQELALAPELTAAENIFLGRHPSSRGFVRWREIYDRAEQILHELGHDIDPRRRVSGAEPRRSSSSSRSPAPSLSSRASSSWMSPPRRSPAATPKACSAPSRPCATAA